MPYDLLRSKRKKGRKDWEDLLYLECDKFCNIDPLFTDRYVQ